MSHPPVKPALLETRGISKSFGAIVANHEIDFRVEASQIHALLGENGAGKSTLMKIICGLQQPDSGSTYWHGKACNIASPKVARGMGIGMVHQHFALFEGLSVTENIAFSIDGAVQGKALEKNILELAERYGMQVEPKRPVFELSAGERQRIEILRALLLNPELLILDEPTSVLTPQEANQLFDTVRILADNGHGIVFISHKLKEVKALCDAATVLRAGKVVRQMRTLGDCRLYINRLSMKDNDQTLTIDDLKVHAGEVFGVAGVAGNGQGLLFAALSGELTAKNNAAININGTASGNSGPNQRRTLGAMFVPEERLGHAAVPHLDLHENVLLTNISNSDAASKGIVNRRYLSQLTDSTKICCWT